MDTRSLDRVATALAAARTRRGALRALAGAALGAAGLASAPGPARAARRRWVNLLFHTFEHICQPDGDLDGDPQTCDAPSRTSFADMGLPRPTPMGIKLTSSPRNCSDISFKLTWRDQDGVHWLITGAMRPGETRPWQQLGSVTDRVRWYEIDAIGVPGGCNQGALERYEVEYLVRVPAEDAAALGG